MLVRSGTGAPPAVFYDPTGRRRRRFRAGLVVITVATLPLIALILAGVFAHVAAPRITARPAAAPQQAAAYGPAGGPDAAGASATPAPAARRPGTSQHGARRHGSRPHSARHHQTRHHQTRRHPAAGAGKKHQRTTHARAGRSDR
jgi:hypothetical protein